jgi:NADPH:quinone reductase-like Zn-dependent oxidoreductase
VNKRRFRILLEVMGMQALVFDQPGEADEVLTYKRDVSIPIPAPGEILIKVNARVIQPADSLFIAARYAVTPNYP